jgi:hypothetical protein
MHSFRLKIGRLRNDKYLNRALAVGYANMEDVLRCIQAHIGGSLAEVISASQISAPWVARYWSSYPTLLKYLGTYTTDNQLQRERDAFHRCEQRRSEVVSAFAQRLEEHFTLGNLSSESRPIGKGELVKNFVRKLKTKDGYARRVKEELKTSGKRWLKMSNDLAIEEWPSICNTVRMVEQEVFGFDNEDTDGPSSRQRSSERRYSDVRAAEAGQAVQEPRSSTSKVAQNGSPTGLTGPGGSGRPRWSRDERGASRGASRERGARWTSRGRENERRDDRGDRNASRGRERSRTRSPARREYVNVIDNEHQKSETRTCWRCGKPGHLNRDCKEILKVEQVRRHQAQYGGEVEKGYYVLRIRCEEPEEEEKADEAEGYTTEYEEDRSEHGYTE